MAHDRQSTLKKKGIFRGLREAKLLRLSIGLLGLLRPPKVLKSLAKVVVVESLVWFKLNGLHVGSYRRLVVLHLFQQDTQIVIGLSGRGVKFEGTSVGTQSFLITLTLT